MLSVRASTDPFYARLHRLAVDAYALQHPDEYCRSAKSLAAHLTGACAAIDREADVERINDAVQRWLSRPETRRGGRTSRALGARPVAQNGVGNALQVSPCRPSRRLDRQAVVDRQHEMRERVGVGSGREVPSLDGTVETLAEERMAFGRLGRELLTQATVA